MIFYSFNQFNCFLIFIFCGIICCLIYDLFNLIFLIKFQKKFKKIIFDSIFYCFFNIFLIFLINFLNFGKINFSILLGFILGFSLTKKSNKNLLVFLENKWYNIFNNKNNKGCKNEIKSKQN